MFKKHIYTYLICAISLCACSEETRFGISTTESEDSNIIYTSSLAGSFSYMATDTVRVFAGGGKTVFRSQSSEPVPVYLRTEDGRNIYILAEQGGQYELKLESDGFSIISNKAQTLYNSLPAPDFITQVAKRYTTHNSAKNLLKATDALLSHEIHPFDSLRQKAEISNKAYKHIKRERDLFWRAVRGNVAYLHYTEKGQLDNEDQRIWKSAFDGLELNDKSLCNKRWYYELAESFVEYKLFSDPELNMEELLKKASEGKLNTIYYQIYTEEFRGHCLEYLTARKIYNAAIQREYEKELTEIYADFCKRFPESAYRRVLDPIIAEVEAFHNATRSNEKIKILDNYLSINSFTELLENFHGQKLYIDVWVTWCGPCKDEFKHNERLRKLLEEEGYTLLYISIDDDKRARNWEQMIYAYDLEGYHIRAGEQLHRELFEIYGSQRLTIPWYIIVDENAQIVNAHAPRPGRLKAENLK